MSYFQKYIQLKKLYLEKKQQGGAFEGYPIIRSKSQDGSFVGDSARGDGLCSIWAILVGFSLLNRDNLIRNEQFLQNSPQPTTMAEVIKLLLDVSNNILLPMMSDDNPFVEFENFRFSRGELEQLVFQLDQDISNITTIQGKAQFQILAMLLGVEIQIFDETTGRIDSIGHDSNDTIRVRTNGAHYHVHSNRTERNLEHFKNRYWWNLQWRGHPHLGYGYTLEPFI